MRCVVKAMVVVAAVLGLGGISAYADPPVHRASGGGQLDIGPLGFPGLPNESYGFHASIDANGAVSGQFQSNFSVPDVTFHMSISCLSVSGNNAWLGGTVTQTHDPSVIPVGTHFIWRVRDNGEGANSPPDKISFFFFVLSPAACNAQPNVGLFDWTHGNIQVR